MRSCRPTIRDDLSFGTGRKSARMTLSRKIILLGVLGEKKKYSYYNSNAGTYNYITI